MSTGDVAQCPKCGRYLYPSDTNILPECDCEKLGGSSGWIRPVLSVEEIAEEINKEPLPEAGKKWEYSMRIAEAIHKAMIKK